MAKRRRLRRRVQRSRVTLSSDCPEPLEGSKGRRYLAIFGAALAFAGAASASAAACTIAPGAAAFAYDNHAPLHITQSTPREAGLTHETNITFVSNGRTIGATLVRPRYVTMAKNAGVLFVHWLGDPATTNRTEFLPDARALAPNGITSLLVDAEWSANDWFGKRTPATDACDTVAQVVALRRALDVLTSQQRMDSARIALVGHDFGAMTGVLVSAVDARPGSVVLMTPTLSFWEWFLLGTPPGDPAAYVSAMSAFDLPRWLPKLHARATLLQFAKRDIYVASATASAFANVVPDRDRTLKRYETDHAMRNAAATNDRRTWLIAHLAAK